MEERPTKTLSIPARSPRRVRRRSAASVGEQHSRVVDAKVEERLSALTAEKDARIELLREETSRLGHCINELTTERHANEQRIREYADRLISVNEEANRLKAENRYLTRQLTRAERHGYMPPQGASIPESLSHEVIKRLRQAFQEGVSYALGECDFEDDPEYPGLDVRTELQGRVIETHEDTVIDQIEADEGFKHLFR